MNGNIYAHNVVYNYMGSEHRGCEFVILLPLKKKSS